MLQWKPETTAATRDAIAAAIGQLPTRIDTIRSYVVGPDAGVDGGNYDLVIVADFDDVEGYVSYRDHPEHRRVITELVVPNLAARAAAQHELP